MKKVIYGILLSSILGVTIYGCQKENIEEFSPNLTKNNGNVTINEVEKTDFKNEITLLAPRKGEIACVVYDNSGNAVCAGKRCGTPTGSCGRRETACSCKTTSKINKDAVTSTGLNINDFIITWNNDSTRENLKKQGFYEKDIE